MADLEAIRRRAVEVRGQHWIGRIEPDLRGLSSTIQDSERQQKEQAFREFMENAPKDILTLLDLCASKDAEIARKQTLLDKTDKLIQDMFDEMAKRTKERDDARALLLTQSQEVWKEAAKIADSRVKDRTRNEYEAGEAAACYGLAAEFEARSHIPPSIGGDRAALRLNISKEQCLRLAELEGDATIGAGLLARDPEPPEEPSIPKTHNPDERV